MMIIVALLVIGFLFFVVPSILGFLVRLMAAIAVSAVLVHFVPGLSHTVFATGQIGFTWLFLITGALVVLFYRWF